MLGHDGPPTAYWRENLMTKEPLERCPLRTLQILNEDERKIDEELQRYQDDYVPAYESGILLRSGGLGNQPARYVQIIRRIRQANAMTERRYVDLSRQRSSED